MYKLKKLTLELNDLAIVKGGEGTEPTEDELDQVGKPITIKAE